MQWKFNTSRDAILNGRFIKFNKMAARICVHLRKRQYRQISPAPMQVEYYYIFFMPTDHPKIVGG